MLKDVNKANNLMAKLGSRKPPLSLVIVGTKTPALEGEAAPVMERNKVDKVGMFAAPDVV